MTAAESCTVVRVDEEFHRRALVKVLVAVWGIGQRDHPGVDGSSGPDLLLHDGIHEAWIGSSMCSKGEEIGMARHMQGGILTEA